MITQPYTILTNVCDISLFLQVTTRTLRLSARRSTSAPTLATPTWSSTASSAPTEPSSTRTTSSATGGSTLTAPPPRTSTASMMRSLLRETLWPGPLTRLSMAPPQSTARPRLPLETIPSPRPGEDAGWAEAGGRAGGDNCRA